MADLPEDFRKRLELAESAIDRLQAFSAELELITTFAQNQNSLMSMIHKRTDDIITCIGPMGELTLTSAAEEAFEKS